MDELIFQNPIEPIQQTIVPFTHKDCVSAATYWLNGKCEIVLPEFFTWNPELPDVIGFKRRESIVVECKISRSDFLADKKKPFRVMPDRGMGDKRYYCCPQGLIKPDELPPSWGLVYIYPSGTVRLIKKAFRQPKDHSAEFHVLFYYARRAQQAGVHKAIIAQRFSN